MTGPTFHEGELAWQERAGSRARLAEAGPRVIRDHMPEQHREFFAQLPFLLAGTVDAQGQPWASVLAGPPGFVASPDPRQLLVHAQALPHDPLAETLRAGAPIGLLGIEPHTRRRNRLNGRVTRRDEGGFAVRVDQSFGNCPKYIQARKPEFVAGTGAPTAHRLDALDEAARSLLARADTFFIATAHPLAARSDSPAFGVDVSHRGGKPGFVRADADSRLTVPDFIGNFFFNTLGNLAVNPRCGLLFMDFASGDLLYLAARGEVVTDGPELASFQGAQRLLRLQVLSALRVTAVLPLRWSAAELSPVLAATGSWS
ncbi:pyridoxamine 5'-phosphate oxidase family protein [Caenimonas soli]|uniref:pyridoxamine 5'-phosphate oxidase family protein n=1 Tax=Caenimonas soli TaxID=2735555 RepID=UPI001555A0FC|nr:pyridoxamine 5'-phosphate oxidase family protein [Caenimonas soli]NPC58868.1 flavin-nucleotide-binding protein [Caenimonas soli]